MSVGNNLQEMENVVTKGAAAAEPMTSAGIPVEDLGGPTPENSRPDDDSNRLREPGATLKQVKDVVNSRAAAAEPRRARRRLRDRGRRGGAVRLPPRRSHRPPTPVRPR